MTDYIKSVESQNDELKNKLAEAQKFIDWHNHRLANKLQFHYRFQCSYYDENHMSFNDAIKHWYISRGVLKSLFPKIRISPISLFDESNFKHLKDKLTEYSFDMVIGKVAIYTDENNKVMNTEILFRTKTIFQAKL